MRLALCLLTWNEKEGCLCDVPRIPLSEFEEIFAIDGGSTDGTVEYLRERGIPVYTQDAAGYNQAYISAFRRCTADALVMFHPKGSIDPYVLTLFRQYFENGNDLVIASRMVKGAQNEEDVKWLRPRKWFVLMLAAFASLIWRKEGKAIRDALHGCRGMRREAFYAIDPLPSGLTIDLEMVVRAYRLGLKRVEFPVKELPRTYGATHFKAWPTGKRMLAYLWHELRRKN